MRRKLPGLFNLLAIIGLLFASACSSSGAAKEQPTPTPLPTTVASSKPTYTVQRGDIMAQTQFSARVIPAIQEELFFRAAGRVRKVYVRSGDPVKKGQVLADLVSLDQMETQAAQQKLNQRRAEINLEMAWLRQQLAATQTPTYDTGYDIKMKMNQYEVELAQISLDEAKLNSQNLDTAITDSQIISTLDGKVLSIAVVEGGEAKSFAPLITVGDDSTLEIGGTLTSTQMQELTEGMPCLIELPNRPGEKLEGKIRSLPYPYGTGGQNTDSAAATGAAADTTTRVSLNNPENVKTFKSGDLVQVTAVKESKTGVLWLPPQAIRTFEGRNFVVVKTDGLPKRVDVKLGIKNEERVEILEGVEEGQVVIAP